MRSSFFMAVYYFHNFFTSKTQLKTCDNRCGSRSRNSFSGISPFNSIYSIDSVILINKDLQLKSYSRAVAQNNYIERCKQIAQETTLTHVRVGLSVLGFQTKDEFSKIAPTKVTSRQDEELECYASTKLQNGKLLLQKSMRCVESMRA